MEVSAFDSHAAAHGYTQVRNTLSLSPSPQRVLREIDEFGG